MFCVFRILFSWIAIEAFYGSTVTGYRWVHLKAGDEIPVETFFLNGKRNTFMGRARHFDEILPAQVHNNSYAEIFSCSKIIRKLEFDVLVDSDNSCMHTQVNEFSDVSENVVRLGTMRNGEPSYLIVTNIDDGNFIGSILLTTRKVLTWENLSSGLNYVLECLEDKWVDSSSDNIPENSVYGGKSEGGDDLYVGRLKLDCDIVPGQVMPTLGIATALINGQDINSLYSQMLVGDTWHYTWVSAQGGEIPDNAVAAATSQQNELMYVGRVNKTLTYIVHSEALQDRMAYEILVRGEKQPEPEITEEVDEQQEPEITEEVDEQQEPEITEGVDEQQEPEITEGVHEQQEPEITEGVDEQQEHEITEGVDEQQEPEITEGVDKQHEHEITEEVDEQQGQEITEGDDQQQIAQQMSNDNEI